MRYKKDDVTCLCGQFEWLEANFGLVSRSGNRDRVLDIKRDRRVLSADAEIFETVFKVVVSLVW